MGILAHYNNGHIENVSVGGRVSGGNYESIGGLVGGNNEGQITRCHVLSGTSVSGSAFVGGLAGFSEVGSSISESSSAASVSGNHSIGGLVGEWTGANGTSIEKSWATGEVNGIYWVGGLVGRAVNSNSRLIETYATGKVTGTHSKIGGLVGETASTILRSYATGHVENTGLSTTNPGGAPSADIGRYTGGLVGINGSMNITDSYALGNVIGHRVSGANNSGIDVGGLVGFSQGQIVGSNRELIPALIDGQDDFLCGFSFATGQVSGYGNVGGLVGRTNASVNNTFAGWWNENSRAVKEGTSTVTARDMNDNLVPVGVDNSLLTGNNFGGLVGQLGNATVTTARLTWSYSVGDVIAPMRNNSNTNTACNVGGLVGDVYGNISTSWAQGSIYGNQCVGGLAGRAATSVQITQCYFTGTIVEGANFVGGLLGQGGNQILYCYSSTKVLLSWSSGQAAGIYGGDTGKPLINYNFVIGSLDLSGGTNGGAIAVHTSMANINAGNWRWAGYVSSTNIPNNNEKNINGAPLSADALRNPGTYGLTDQLGEISGSSFTNFGTWGGRDWIYNSSKLQFPLLGFGPEQPYIPFLYYLFGANYPIVYGNDLFGAEITGIDFNQARAIVSSDIPPVIPTKKHDDYDVTIQISEIFQVDASSSVAGQYDKSGTALSDYTYELIGSTNEALKGQKPEIIVSWSEEFRIHETTRICYSDGYITLKFNSMNPLPNYLASMTPQNNVFDMKSNAFKTYLGENYRFRATEKSTNGQQFDTGNLYIAPKEITVQGEVTDKMWMVRRKQNGYPIKGQNKIQPFSIKSATPIRQ